MLWCVVIVNISKGRAYDLVVIFVRSLLRTKDPFHLLGDYLLFCCAGGRPVILSLSCQEFETHSNTRISSRN